eukprot:UN21779
MEFGGCSYQFVWKRKSFVATVINYLTKCQEKKRDLNECINYIEELLHVEVKKVEEPKLKSELYKQLCSINKEEYYNNFNR